MQDQSKPKSIHRYPRTDSTDLAKVKSSDQELIIRLLDWEYNIRHVGSHGRGSTKLGGPYVGSAQVVVVERIEVGYGQVRRRLRLAKGHLQEDREGDPENYMMVNASPEICRKSRSFFRC